MDQKDIELRLKTALDHAVPDVKDQILKRCADENSEQDRIVPMDLRHKRRRRNSNWSVYVAAAAILLLLVNVGGSLIKSRQEHHTETVICLDVNPSIELAINAQNRVITATAVNADAIVILQNMNLSGSTAEVAVNAVLGSMLKHGYLDENANSILLTVDNKDEQESRRIETELVQDINETLQSYSVEASILSQSVTTDVVVDQTATDYEISRGRTILIQKIIDDNPYYTFEELSQLTINELNLLLNSQRVEVQTVNTVGVASEKSYIGQEMAVEIVLLSFGVNRDNVKDLYADIDVLDARMVYGVSFLYEDMIHSYEVDALTGAIVSNYTKEPGLEETVSSNVTSDTESGNAMGVPANGNNATEEPSGNHSTGRPNSSLSENTVSENTVSDNQSSGDEEDEITVSDNSISENTVSENEVSESGRMDTHVINQYEGKYIYIFVKRCGIPADAELLWMETEDREGLFDGEYSDEWIKTEQAQALILAHTQLKQNDITYTLMAVYEREDQYYYLIEFETKTHVYQYLLDAVDGIMIEYEKRLIGQ